MDDPPPAEGRSAGHLAPVDDLDRRIIAALQQDGRMSMRALAALLHISRANAYSRVQRLERAGVIAGYAAVVDPARLGYGLSAYVYLKIQQQSWKAVRDRVLRMAEVDHAALVSGENDIVLLVRAADTAALRDFVLTGLQEIPQVQGTQTVLIFDESAPRRPR
jgi:DNA-binding Lrp family transcriptional regulator